MQDSKPGRSRYRDWIEHAPDMIWAVDSGGAQLYLSERRLRNDHGLYQAGSLLRSGANRSSCEPRRPIGAIRDPDRGQERRRGRSGSEKRAAGGARSQRRSGGDRPRRHCAATRGSAAGHFEFLFSKLPHAHVGFRSGDLAVPGGKRRRSRAAVRLHARGIHGHVLSPIYGPSGDSARFLTFLEQLPAEGHGRAGHWRHLAKGGRIFDAEVFWRLVEYDGRKAILSTIHDITERKMLEEQPAAGAQAGSGGPAGWRNCARF